MIGSIYRKLSPKAEIKALQSRASATQQVTSKRVASAKFRHNDTTVTERCASPNVKVSGEFLYVKHTRVPGAYAEKRSTNESQVKIKELRGEIEQWSTFEQEVNLEREFYLKKLMRVKNLCKSEENNPICPKVLKVIKELEDCDINVTF